ncbi:hypothetical protein [Moraxella catarrhalis]|uniref:hypothetical protein n=1 Tax=Moraxella catarrhalis TaxID=480 RepID=UPI0009C394F7|nr:hypothetical protein [Moraxella catarrhalis]ARE65434.1 hypothetical protein MC195_01160 [Moraxella catarrhalis]
MQKATATIRLGKSEQVVTGRISYQDGQYHSVILSVSVCLGGHEIELDLQAHDDWQIAEVLAIQAGLFEPIALSENIKGVA